MMAELAIGRMTLDEFLRWDDGTDTRYELINGFPLAMAPSARAHGILCATLGAMINAGLRTKRSCRAQTEAGILHPARGDTFYIADLAVTCRPHEWGEQLLRDPILILEILSRGTERHDRRAKVPAFRDIDSVREILLVDSEAAYAELFRRRDTGWLSEIVPGQNTELHLSSIDLRLSMTELYEGLDIELETAS
jgi:Uma2 family endonuclease